MGGGHEMGEAEPSVPAADLVKAVPPPWKGKRDLTLDYDLSYLDL